MYGVAVGDVADIPLKRLAGGDQIEIEGGSKYAPVTLAVR